MSTLLNDMLKLNNNELLLIINVNSAQIKAFVINELNYSEFDLNLNGIEICSSISNQNLISLLIHQFKLFHSLKTDLNNKNNNVESSSSSSSQEDMIISRNNNSMLSNPMISIGLKSKLKNQNSIIIWNVKKIIIRKQSLSFLNY